MELFPCKLPIGYPTEDMWPAYPVVSSSETVRERQITLMIRFPFLRPAIFSKMIVLIEQRRQKHRSCWYFANHIIEVQSISGNRCNIRTSEPGGMQMCKIHYKLKAHVREIWVSIRGDRPCCHVSGVKTLVEDAIGKLKMFLAMSHQLFLLVVHNVLSKIILSLVFSMIPNFVTFPKTKLSVTEVTHLHLVRICYLVKLCSHICQNLPLSGGLVSMLSIVIKVVLRC